MHWHGVTKRAVWRHLVDVRADFPHADAVGLFTVFNIGGNKWRIAVFVHYRKQIVYIKRIGAHEEYDKWDL